MGELIAFDAGRPPAIAMQRPSALNAAAQANVHASFAVIGYKGKNWRIKHRGVETLITDDRDIPVPTLEVVIVGVSPHISKIYYDKKYADGDSAAPDCFSVDGNAPDPAAPKRQAATCATCPMNQWGSRTSNEGKKGKACQDNRRIAVVPHGDLENEAYGGPMMLRIPPMSLGNLATYGSMLQHKGAGMEFVSTRLGFDYKLAYPLITFTPLGWLTDEEARQVVGPDGKGGICADARISAMLQDASVEVSHDPVSGEAAQDDPLAGSPPAAAAAAAAQAAVQAAAAQEAAVKAAAAQAAQEIAAQAAQKAAAAPTPAAVPAKKKSAFAATAQRAAEAAPAPATTVVATAAAAVAGTPLPVEVQKAPDDMQTALDALLAAPLPA